MQTGDKHEEVPDHSRMALTLPDLMWIEKQEGLGEDAKPWAFDAPDGSKILAVFDGLGGSGGGKVLTARGDEISEARLASNLAAECVRDFFGRVAKQGDLIEIKEGLASSLKEGFAERTLQVSRRPSGIKSGLKRELPTTACIMRIVPAERSDDSAKYQIFWAGDSRAYIYAKDGVLRCLTRDHVHLKGALDAATYYLLQEDAQMTNVICASSEFFLEAIELTIPAVAAFVCSDGLYNAFKTHCLFESFMLSALLGKHSEKSFEEIINERRNDDVSLSLTWFNRDFDPDPFLKRLDVVTGDDKNGELSLSLLVTEIAGFDFLYSDALRRLDREQLKLGQSVNGRRNSTLRRIPGRFVRSLRTVATNEFLPLTLLLVLLGVLYLAYDTRERIYDQHFAARLIQVHPSHQVNKAE